MSHAIRLIHWKTSEAAQLASNLTEMGFHVNFDPIDPEELRALRRAPPDAVVIDLSRLPAQGRDVAVWLRQSKSTRQVPVVFVGGDPKKVERSKKLLPDATYTSWSRIKGDLESAISSAPKQVHVPGGVMAAYTGTPLIKKLGIKRNAVVSLINAPADFTTNLGDLPEGVRIRNHARGRRDLTIWFATSLKDLENRIDRLSAQVGSGGLWIVWPKKSSGVKSDLSQTLVRKIGLAAGLVDYKVISVDQTWSGLKFSVRKSD